jgi:hypothetical protein
MIIAQIAYELLIGRSFLKRPARINLAPCTEQALVEPNAPSKQRAGG